MVKNMAKGIKISDLSKDFAMKSKDVIEEFKSVNIEKTTGGTVSDEEFAVFMQHLTSKNQISDLEAYRQGKITIRIAGKAKEAPKAAPAPKAEAKAEPKGDYRKYRTLKAFHFFTSCSLERLLINSVAESNSLSKG